MTPSIDSLPLFQPRTLPQAREAGDRGMATALEHAETVVPGFSDRAQACILAYLRFYGATSGEVLTDVCSRAGIFPTDLRAFGTVYRVLSRAGKIKRVGQCARVRGHGTSGGNVWEAVK